MQRIERYGVIALVLLLVTIAAVSFWDDGSVDNSSPNRDGKAKSERVAARDKAGRSAGGQAKNVSVGNRELPVTSAKQGPTKAANSSASDPAARKWTSRRTIPSKSKKTGFETLSATVIDGGEDSAEGRGQERVDRNRPKNGTSKGREQEVDFPTSLTREGGSIASSGEVPGAKEKQERRDSRTKGFESKERATRQQDEETAVAGSGSYTVRPGDTLSQIAERRLGSSRRWGEIQALNGGINPSSIYVGQVLVMPDASSDADSGVAGRSLRTVTTPSSVELPGGRGEGVFYTVRSGDSLSQIAQDHLGGASKWKSIVAANPGLDPNSLGVGTRLRMPATSSNTVASLQASATPSRSRKKNRVR